MLIKVKKVCKRSTYKDYYFRRIGHQMKTESGLDKVKEEK